MADSLGPLCLLRYPTERCDCAYSWLKGSENCCTYSPGQSETSTMLTDILVTLSRMPIALIVLAILDKTKNVIREDEEI